MPEKRQPWAPDLVPKGYQIYNCYKRYVLVDGPRKSAKTISNLHKVVRHAFEFPGARVAIVTKTTRNAKSGIWEDLLRFVIPKWEKAGTGFMVTKPSTMAPDTKMTYIRIRSRGYRGTDGKIHYGESEIQLHSVEYTAEAEAKFKSMRFSMVYLSEADQWDSRQVFTILSQQLRMLGPPAPDESWAFIDHQMIIDCNPPEEGEQHWIYGLFWVENAVDKPDSERTVDQLDYHRIGFTLDDNTKLDPNERRELENSCRYDPNLYDRWILGKWVRDLSNTLFKGAFFPQRHIIGHTHGREEDWEFIVPTENCFEFYSGWDLGDKNNAIEFAVKREFGGSAASWDFIDEVVYKQQMIKTADIVEAVMEVMDFWEEYVKTNYGTAKVQWKHWSDDTAFNRYRAGLDTFDYMIVQQASANRIQLRPSTKGRDSIKLRKNMLRKMLFEDRVHVSARCPHLIESLSKMKPGKSKLQVIDADSEYKHAFDAATYLLGMECPHDLATRLKPATNHIVSIPA